MNNSSIFTLQRKGNGFDIEEYPGEIYVDTSVWNKIYGSQNSSQNKAILTDFMSECLEHDVKFYSSGVVYEELAHIVREDIIRQEAYKFPDIKVKKYSDGQINYKDRDRQLIDRNPSILNTIESSVNEAINFVRQTSEFLPFEETEELTKLMLQLMKQSGYELDTRDIKHVLAAHTYDINSVLTCDGDYAGFDNLNVYVPPNEKYAKLKIGRANVLLPFDPEKY